MNSDRISYGISISKITLSNLTKEEAIETITPIYTKKLESLDFIKLTYKGQSWVINPSDIDLKIDLQGTVNEAYSIGRNPNIIKGFMERIDSIINGREISSKVTYNEDKLKSILKQIAIKTDEPSKNAECTLTDKGEILITPEIIGQTLSIDDFSNELKNIILALQLPQNISIPLTESAPLVTANSLKGIDTILSSYSTQFNNSNYKRSENIRISAASLNHILIDPEQIISFNELVGLRLAQAGYQEAPVLIDGKSVPDIGGGVCQVSSTLYNTVLLANLKSVERISHFYPSSYVPMGLDATVADHLLDFKFQNILKNPIYIITQVYQGTVSIYILGNHDDLSPYKISLISIIEQTTSPPISLRYDKSLPAGSRILIDSGKPGYIVSAYRLKRINDKEIERELLHTDTYSPTDKVFLIGTR